MHYMWIVLLALGVLLVLVVGDIAEACRTSRMRTRKEPAPLAQMLLGGVATAVFSALVMVMLLLGVLGAQGALDLTSGVNISGAARFVLLCVVLSLVLAVDVLQRVAETAPHNA